MVLVGVTDHREPVLWPLRDEHVQQTPVLCAQPPTSLTYAAKGWYLQPSTEVCTWATRVASPPESQSWKCLGDYILSGQPVANYWGTGAKPSSPASTLWCAICVLELPVGSEGGWHFIWYCSFDSLFSFPYPVTLICLPFSTGRTSLIKPLVLESNLKHHGSPFSPQRCVQEWNWDPRWPHQNLLDIFRTWARGWGLSFFYNQQAVRMWCESS